MLFASLWERWQSPQDQNIIVDFCAIITCDACLTIHPLHDRMPVIIPQDQSDIWLKGSLDHASALLTPMRATTFSSPQPIR